MIGIGGTTGIQEATRTILGGLPSHFPIPIVVISPIPDDLQDRFVAFLDRGTLLKVVRAVEGVRPEPGWVYVAGVVNQRPILENGCLRYSPAEPGVWDGLDVFFRSMARELGSCTVAVILSGLGLDGVGGMKAVREAGGHTIAQDEATSLVYGKPRYAFESGAASESLPVDRIAPRLLEIAAEGASPGS